jgi:UDP:flavonoid glycosyltransferase YjiC (YdhE family)
MPASPGKSRIVVTTWGSLGDLHPYLAIALGLQQRGHDVRVATAEFYRSKIEALGLNFHPVRPDVDVIVNDRERMQRMMTGRLATVRVVRELLLPVLRDSYHDILHVAEGADLLLSHLPWATRLVAEKTGIPWVSTMITPMGFFSTYDGTVMPLMPQGIHRLLGPRVLGALQRCGKWATRPWARPFDRFRTELGLPPTNEDNPLGDSHSPLRVLALFSPHFAPPQPDWPPQAIATGFPTYDRDEATPPSPELERFLQAGPPPIVFTQGISSALIASRFYAESLAAAKALGMRAILVLGKNPANELRDLPADVLSVHYAPFSELFPRCAAVVHHGGIGTTGLALQAGRPTLVVPSAHDQPDNAARVARLGVGSVLPLRRYTAGRAVRALRRLLEEPAVAERAMVLARKLEAEDGVAGACDALEAVLVGSQASKFA